MAICTLSSLVTGFLCTNDGIAFPRGMEYGFGETLGILCFKTVFYFQWSLEYNWNAIFG